METNTVIDDAQRDSQIENLTERIVADLPDGNEQVVFLKDRTGQYSYCYNYQIGEKEKAKGVKSFTIDIDLETTQKDLLEILSDF